MQKMLDKNIKNLLGYYARHLAEALSKSDSKTHQTAGNVRRLSKFMFFARYIIGKKNRKQKSFTNVTLKHFLYAQGHCEYVVFLRGFEKVC